VARRPLRSLFALAQGVSTDTMLAQSRSMLFSLSRPLILGLLLGMSCAPDCEGYSVLSHEAIVDAAWKDGIVPLLLSRFPDATPEKEPPGSGRQKKELARASESLIRKIKKIGIRRLVRFGLGRRILEKLCRQVLKAVDRVSLDANLKGSTG